MESKRGVFADAAELMLVSTGWSEGTNRVDGAVDKKHVSKAIQEEGIAADAQSQCMVLKRGLCLWWWSTSSERIAPASAYVCCGCGGWKCEGTPPGLAAYQRSDIVVV